MDVSTKQVILSRPTIRIASRIMQIAIYPLLPANFALTLLSPPLSSVAAPVCYNLLLSPSQADFQPQGGWQVIADCCGDASLAYAAALAGFNNIYYSNISVTESRQRFSPQIAARLYPALPLPFFEPMPAAGVSSRQQRIKLVQHQFRTWWKHQVQAGLLTTELE